MPCRGQSFLPEVPMKYFLILLVILSTASTSAQNQKTQITDVARKIISNTTDIQLTSANSRVSPGVEQQIRAIADKLSAAQPILITGVQDQTKDGIFSSTNLFSKIKKNLLVGGSILLVLLVVHFALKKYDEKKTGGKSRNIADISYKTRNAPFLVSVILASQTEAETLAHDLITQHLIARADILPHQHVATPSNTEGVLLIAQTVKGRLKKLLNHLQKHALSPFALPILRGHKDHLQWIVNTADGKG